MSLELRALERSDAMISAFLKDEKANLTRKDEPCGRLIQPRSSRFNIEIGRHLKPMEKRIFRGIAEVFGGVTVMKGLNADERGYQLARKWKKFDNPVAVLLDAKRFDQHCNSQVIDWEHGVYEAMAVDRPTLRRLNAMRKTNICYARLACGYVIRYILTGGRMSGDMDTALGNCLTMCAMTWSFMRHLSIRKFEYMNDGDDGVLIIEKSDLTAVLNSHFDYFLQLGFTMKLEGIAHIMEHVEFCQARPVEIQDGIWRFIRDPEIALAKDSMTLKSVKSVEELQQLSNANGWCGASLAGDVPIFCEFYKRMITGARPVDFEIKTGMQMLAKRMEPKFTPPTDVCRVSFFNAFGICPDVQCYLEDDIRNTQYYLNSMPTPGDFTTTLNDIRIHKQDYPHIHQ